jgi:hypothetical protein
MRWLIWFCLQRRLALVVQVVETIAVGFALLMVPYTNCLSGISGAPANMPVVVRLDAAVRYLRLGASFVLPFQQSRKQEEEK